MCAIWPVWGLLPLGRGKQLLSAVAPRKHVLSRSERRLCQRRVCKVPAFSRPCKPPRTESCGVDDIHMSLRWRSPLGVRRFVAAFPSQECWSPCRWIAGGETGVAHFFRSEAFVRSRVAAPEDKDAEIRVSASSLRIVGFRSAKARPFAERKATLLSVASAKCPASSALQAACTESCGVDDIHMSLRWRSPLGVRRFVAAFRRESVVPPVDGSQEGKRGVAHFFRSEAFVRSRVAAPEEKDAEIRVSASAHLPRSLLRESTSSRGAKGDFAQRRVCKVPAFSRPCKPRRTESCGVDDIHMSLRWRSPLLSAAIRRRFPSQEVSGPRVDGSQEGKRGVAHFFRSEAFVRSRVAAPEDKDAEIRVSASAASRRPYPST